MPSLEQVAPFMAVAMMPLPSTPVSAVSLLSLHPRKSNSWSGSRTTVGAGVGTSASVGTSVSVGIVVGAKPLVMFSTARLPDPRPETNTSFFA